MKRFNCKKIKQEIQKRFGIQFDRLGWYDEYTEGKKSSFCVAGNIIFSRVENRTSRGFVPSDINDTNEAIERITTIILDNYFPIAKAQYRDKKIDEILND